MLPVPPALVQARLQQVRAHDVWRMDVKHTGDAPSLVLQTQTQTKTHEIKVKTTSDDNQAVEVDPRTNKQVKTFSHDFSEHQGSVQRLANGNTLIVNGYSKTIDELDELGNVVWSMETADKISKAYRYGPEHPGLSNLKKR